MSDRFVKNHQKKIDMLIFLFRNSAVSFCFVFGVFVCLFVLQPLERDLATLSAPLGSRKSICFARCEVNNFLRNTYFYVCCLLCLISFYMFYLSLSNVFVWLVCMIDSKINVFVVFKTLSSPGPGGHLNNYVVDMRDKRNAKKELFFGYKRDSRESCLGVKMSLFLRERVLLDSIRGHFSNSTKHVLQKNLLRGKFLGKSRSRDIPV